MNTLPTIDEIKKWSDAQLISVINSGERINWNCGLNETQHEIDNYVESVYRELELRDMRFNRNFDIPGQIQ